MHKLIYMLMKIFSIRHGIKCFVGVFVRFIVLNSSHKMFTCNNAIMDTDWCF